MAYPEPTEVAPWYLRNITQALELNETTGPVFLPNYKVIGNGVGVPDGLYKIIVERNSSKVMAYMMPNAPLPVADLPKYQTTMTAVEQATGIQSNLGK